MEAFAGMMVAAVAWTWLIGACVSCWVAEEKGRPAWKWFFVCLIAGPFITLLALAAIDREDSACDSPTKTTDLTHYGFPVQDLRERHVHD
jgi:hypothetical protein